MARIKSPAGLPDLVKTTFAKALSEDALNYYPTRVTLLKVESIPFQLRFSPALANKPKGPPPPSDVTTRKPFDPFANPPAALKITDLSPSHYLVLNKFAVVPEHFILATTESKPQTYVLEADDLDATRACIEAYEAQGQDGAGLFAFFNCGEHSGASQPHRHIQLLPVARMRDGLEDGDRHAWSVLADRLAEGAVAPFKTFTERISLNMSGEDLWAVYLRLYRQACRATTNADVEAAAVGEVAISYNMAMTSSSLTICPRLSEGQVIKATDGSVIGKLALNGTVLAGTALVKSEGEWDALRNDEGCLAGLLQGIGIPSKI